MRTVVLLGPQRLRPTLVEAVDRAGVRGAIAAVTAGWQEREDEIDELSEHLKRSVFNLRLHRRGEDVLARDPEFLLAYGDHLDRRRQMQDLYRIRVRHEKASIRDLLDEPMDPSVVDPEVERAMAALRALDNEHRSRVRRLEAAFESEWAPGERPVVAEHRAEVAETLSRCEGLAIAGGHVQVLLDRLRLFNVAQACGELAVFAWSAGAMVACETVVLFHDSPPQGANDEEVLSDGLGLCHGVVALPHAKRRLALDDARRVRLLAKRFKPARCLALDEGSLAWCVGDGVELRVGRELRLDGTIVEAAAP